MPLGEGYTAEEQLTGAAEHGGVQITVQPMKRSAFERWFPKVLRRQLTLDDMRSCVCFCVAPAGAAMGLAPGGRMRQEIYKDPYDVNDWEERPVAQCFVHLTNSQQWRQITGQAPPQKPVMAKQYAAAGVPWFDYYSEAPALPGSDRLASLKSLFTLGREKGDRDLPDDEPATPAPVVPLRRDLRPGQVREGQF